MSGGFEELVVERGRRSGAMIAIAVHSTRLGPALGGARIWRYPDPDATIAEAMRLAAAMTDKAAVAGLELGGGKGVISNPGRARPTGELRRALLLDFGDQVEELEGRYVTAEDVGTSAADMEVIAERTSHVVGRGVERGGSGDPSPVTALGVRAAIRACAASRFGSPSLSGHRVVIVGAGNVGLKLARLLAEDGATLAITDIDPSREVATRALGADWLQPVEALSSPCSILAPCALGGVLDHERVGRLRCEIVCGAANNILVSESVAEEMRRRGILYAPDFVANAGGLISVYGELRGYEHDRMLGLARGIEATMAAVLEEAERRGITPLRAAQDRARSRLERASRLPVRA